MSPFYERDRRRSRHFIPLFLLTSIHTFMIRFGPLARAIMMTVFKKRQGMYGLKIHNPIVPGDWFDAEYSEDRWYLAIVMSTNQYTNSVLVHFQRQSASEKIDKFDRDRQKLTGSTAQSHEAVVSAKDE
eukprot:91595_1